MSEKKLQAARKAVEFVKDGMVLGLGTGSTTRLAVDEIGKLVASGYKLVGIPTSIETEKQARSLGIPLTTLDQVKEIDLTIDGADEVDPRFRLIKGLGGALLREKIVAYHSKEEIIIVDDSKMVDQLGVKTPLPIEVIPFSHVRTKEAIEALGCVASLRGGDRPFVTDNGNYIYDCKFKVISEPEKIERDLNSIPGVVENGLFIGLASRVVVGTEKGAVVKERA
ncbi:ribose-5-phosphate isomerase RpiA [Methanomassiliicoccus luminyensis]|jgi:ribose 5-phosphate isomerase A|uniref:ribose-5-phosphate isomerase RpiA n=1 Tax=Methanomassiliicoccus luminyensis TaxID=1080712 RepID=UPI00036C8188|nr:ribose-5-phosphate isomerase RpiA [Methanomassiliicoccus luminyensis]